jgi:isoleucyl-tRNA synthetase
LESDGKVSLALPDGPVELSKEDLQIRLQAKEGWAASQGATSVVVLSTELTPALIAEGLAREFVHAVQNERKQRDYQYTDRIVLGIETTEDALRQAIKDHAGYIRGETLAVELSEGALPDADPVELTIPGAGELKIWIKVA